MLVDKQSELMSDLLFTVHQHGGDDVTWKPPIVFLTKHRKQVILYPQKADIENTLPSYEIRNLECSWKKISIWLHNFVFPPILPHSRHATQPGEGHVLYFIKYLSSLHRCSIVASICILKHALTGRKLCRNFHAEMSSSQSEERTMFFTHENNKTSNQNRERCSSTWEKNDTCNQKATEVCEFRAKISAFYRRLQLAAPSIFELLPRHSTNKDLLSHKVFAFEKWKRSRKLQLDWNIFFRWQYRWRNLKRDGKTIVEGEKQKKTY